MNEYETIATNREQLHYSVALLCGGTAYYRAQLISMWLSGSQIQYDDEAAVTSVFGSQNSKVDSVNLFTRRPFCSHVMLRVGTHS